MTSKPPKNRIPKEMHETAKDFYEIGLIDKQRMTEYDLLCNPGLESCSTAQNHGSNSGMSTERREDADPIAIFRGSLRDGDSLADNLAQEHRQEVLRESNHS